MKRRSPEYQKESLVVGSWRGEERLEGILFQHQTLDISNTVEFQGCYFDRCCFTGSGKVTFLDCTLETCDFTNVAYSGGSLIRVEVLHSKLVGADFCNSTWKDVLWQSNQMQYINLSGTKLEFVAFQDCDLLESGMGLLKWRELSFDQCRLDGSELLGTKLKQLDLSTCSIDRLFLNPEDLVGVQISAVQAIPLIQYFGIQIKE